MNIKNNLICFIKEKTPKLYLKLKALKNRLKKMSYKQILNYWYFPQDGLNSAEGYLEPIKRSEFLLKLLEFAEIPKNARIMELGTNACRNLNHLYENGYHNLYGIEISTYALNVAKEYFPKTVEHILLWNDAIERILPTFFSDFDVIFTMAVLMHIHPKASNVVFSTMARLSKVIIIIEDEKADFTHHFSYDYTKIFESYGFTQIYRKSHLGEHQFEEKYTAKIFRKKKTLENAN